MKSLSEYRKCSGCDFEVIECFKHQELGYLSGLEFDDEHVSFFVIDNETDKFIVPYFDKQEEGE